MSERRQEVKPVGWLVTWLDGERSYHHGSDKPNASKDVICEPLFAAPPSDSPGSAPLETESKGYKACRENLREAWSALAMIRETVETLGKPGAVKGSEYLDGPTFMHEADALVAGIISLAHQPQGGDAREAWWKILADNWRGRNGNSTTGDSVRNSCADELEKVAKRHAATPPAPVRAAAEPDDSFSNMLWDWFEDESRIGAEGMRPERREGLSAADFKIMLDEHEQALLAAAEPGEWQSMKSAPKDGTAFLGVWWSDISHGGLPKSHIGICSWAGAWTPYDRKLTHWKPLPATPALSPASANEEET